VRRWTEGMTMADADRCVMCGAIIPEGSHVCEMCGKTEFPYEPDGKAHKCRSGCVYAGKLVDMPCCNYLFDAGHPRPCPAGKGCTAYKRGKRKKPVWMEVVE
jgi:hypothetical protein